MLETPTQSVPAAEVAGKTLVEEFMALSYEFRRNVLSDKYEMREVCNDSEASQADGRPADTNPKLCLFHRPSKIRCMTQKSSIPP